MPKTVLRSARPTITALWLAAILFLVVAVAASPTLGYRIRVEFG
jgi:hypothetical protein